MTEKRPSTPRRVTLRFAWYDLWIGAFYDQAKRTLYVCPLPTLLITWRLSGKANAERVERPSRPLYPEGVCPWCGQAVRRDSRGVWGRESNLRCPGTPDGKHVLETPESGPSEVSS